MLLYFLVWLGLTVGNFLYQAFGSNDWLAATERSFFQAFAVFAVAIAIYLDNLWTS